MRVVAAVQRSVVAPRTVSPPKVGCFLGLADDLAQGSSAVRSRSLARGPRAPAAAEWQGAVRQRIPFRLTPHAPDPRAKAALVSTTAEV
jgi:hypothetical protein